MTTTTISTTGAMASRKPRRITGITARYKPMQRTACSVCREETLFVADRCIHCDNPRCASNVKRRGPGRPPKGWNGAQQPA